MKFKTLTVALALLLAPTLSFATGCSHSKQAISCAEGSIYDSKTGGCNLSTS